MTGFWNFKVVEEPVLVHFIDKRVCSLYCMQRNTSIRGISLGNGRSILSFSWRWIRDGVMSCDMLQLASMKELHLLRLDGCDVVVPDGFSNWPQELRWLQWRSICFSSLPSHLRLPSLVVLDLSYSDKLTRLWKNDAGIQVFYGCCVLSWLGYREKFQYSLIVLFLWWCLFFL